MRKSCAVILLFSLSQCYAMDELVVENFSDFDSNDKIKLSSLRQLKNILRENNILEVNKISTSNGLRDSSDESFSLESFLNKHDISPRLLVKLLENTTHSKFDVGKGQKEFFEEVQLEDPTGYAKMTHAACKDLLKQCTKKKSEDYKQYKCVSQVDDGMGFKQLVMKKQQESIALLKAKYEIEKQRADDEFVRNERKKDAECSRFSSYVEYLKTNAVSLVNSIPILITLYLQVTGGSPGGGGADNITLTT